MDTKKISKWLLSTPEFKPDSIILLRLMAGGVFFWEGLLKFVYTNQGVGRFTKIGIPFPEFSAHFIAILEILGGLGLIFGLMTRPFAALFVCQMIVAILSTKISLYLGTSPLPLPPAPPQVGLWAVLHETRTDFAQIITSIFLLINGPGRISLDARLFARKEKEKFARVA
jgi:uncharacterized membrane protein YphA (DoxX/SURF4 family)